jgi:hypothetical protein
MDVQGLQPLSNLGFGYAVAQVFQQQAYASNLRVRKSVKTLTLALIEEPQGAKSGRKPSAVSGNTKRTSSFICATSLLADLARIQSRNLGVFFTPDTYTGVLLRRSP